MVTDKGSSSALIRLCQRLVGWRLWLFFSGICVVGAVGIVAVMDLILMGQITADYLLTGLITAAIVAPLTLGLLHALLVELAKSQCALLENAANQADDWLKLALDAAQLVPWECKFADDTIHYDAARSVFLGLAIEDAPETLPDWIKRVHPDDRAEFERRVEACVRDGDHTFDFEYRLSGSRGHYEWLQTHGRVIQRDPDGRAVLGVGTTKNISERKRVEARLAESRNLLRTIIDTAPLRVFWKDRSSHYLGCSPSFAQDSGLSGPEAVVGKMDHQMGWAEQANLYRDDDLSVMESGRAKLGYVEPQTTPDGGRIWLRTSKVPLRDAAGEIIGVLGIYDDITEQKEAEEALREMAFFLKESEQIGRVGGWRADPVRNTVMWTEGVSAIVERPLDYKPDLDVALNEYLPESRRRVKASLQHVLETGEPFTIDVEVRGAQSGKIKWAELRGFPHYGADGGIDYVMGTLQDITERRDAELALRSEAALRRQIVESLPGIFYLFDESGRFLSWNRNMETVTQRSAEEMARTHPLDLFEGEDKLLVAQRIEEVFASGQATVEANMVAKDGSRTPLYLTGLTITIGGKPALIGTGVDISARKRAEAELGQYRRHLEELVQRRTAELMATEAKASHILQSSADGLYGVDEDGIVTFINRAALALLGYTEDQVVGRSAHALFHHSKADGTPYLREECPAHQSLKKHTEIRIDDQVYWHADGHAIPVMYSVHPMVHHDQFAGAVISFVDISVQRAAAEARERALLAAENLARIRSQFLANMSHEIRTPLNGVLGFAQIGLRNPGDSDKARNAFEKIIGSGNILLSVINEILDFSKIEAGKLQIDAIKMSPAELVRNAVEVVEAQAHAKQLSLNVELAPNLPAACIGDPFRLGQVLRNLLSNAVKFTESGSVSVAAMKDGAELVFRIADSGIGMTEEQRNALFQPFQQADGSTTRRFGGTGLGLAIAKRLLDLMHGEINVDSQIGVGSTFEIRIPYIETKTAKIERADDERDGPSSPEKPLLGLTILVAEDDEINQVVLEDILQDQGAQVVMVANGREAVERVMSDGAQAFQVVLMDIQMPEMDGSEAARRIATVAPDLPIIGQTAHALPEEKARCLASGMVDHIAKPWNAQELTRVILEHLRR